MVQQAKHWAVTLNNYTSEEYEKLCKTTASYCIIAKETGETGTPHLQCHFYFKQKISARKLKSLTSSRIHCEIARNPSASIEYCRKDCNYQEIGELPIKRGHRSDLDALKSSLRRGATLKEVSEQHFSMFIKYERSIRRFIEINDNGRSMDAETIVNVYWGPTGSGKTRRAYIEANDANQEMYSHSGSEWFDGYLGHRRVLFDDFGGHEFKLTYLLKLLDRYPMRVPIKGSFVQWKPEIITITSNKHPDDWYPNAFPEHRRALKRRLTNIVEITSNE